MSFKQIGKIQTFVGIEQGANGGIAINRGGEVFLYKMPKTTLDLSGLAYVTAHPMKWQSFLNVRLKGMEKAARKRHFKEVAQNLYPQTRQTLWAADATLIMHFGMMAAEMNPQYLRSKMPKEQYNTLFKAERAK